METLKDWIENQIKLCHWSEIDTSMRMIAERTADKVLDFAREKSFPVLDCHTGLPGCRGINMQVVALGDLEQCILGTKEQK